MVLKVIGLEISKEKEEKSKDWTIWGVRVQMMKNNLAILLFLQSPCKQRVGFMGSVSFVLSGHGSFELVSSRKATEIKERVLPGVHRVGCTPLSLLKLMQRSMVGQLYLNQRALVDLQLSHSITNVRTSEAAGSNSVCLPYFAILI